MIIGYRKTNTETNQVEDIIFAESQSDSDFIPNIQLFLLEIQQLGIIDYFIAERISPTEYNKLAVLNKEVCSMIEIVSQIQSGA